jgi:hypothetical protein
MRALADAQTAYNQMLALPPGVGTFHNPGAGNLAGLTLPPGIYTFPTTAIISKGALPVGNLILDAQGNANAFWVFQVGTSLTVGDPGFPQSVILINGALAQNVFWQVGTSATINGVSGTGTMTGTVIAQQAVTVSTAGQVAPVTWNGRALSLLAGVVLNNTIINVPPQ